MAVCRRAGGEVTIEVIASQPLLVWQAGSHIDRQDGGRAGVRCLEPTTRGDDCGGNFSIRTGTDLSAKNRRRTRAVCCLEQSFHFQENFLILKKFDILQIDFCYSS